LLAQPLNSRESVALPNSDVSTVVNIVRQGYLEKQGVYNRSWKNRWVVLHGMPLLMTIRCKYKLRQISSDKNVFHLHQFGCIDEMLSYYESHTDLIARGHIHLGRDATIRDHGPDACTFEVIMDNACLLRFVGMDSIFYFIDVIPLPSQLFVPGRIFKFQTPDPATSRGWVNDIQNHVPSLHYSREVPQLK
jgi:hypothetical protein